MAHDPENAACPLNDPVYDVAPVVPLSLCTCQPKMCTACGKSPRGPMRSITDVLLGRHMCNACLEKRESTLDTPIASCTACGQRPPRETRTLVEVATGHHFCEPCWNEKLETLKSVDIEKKAQAQFDKLMRDVGRGMDPIEAWDRKNEDDG